MHKESSTGEGGAHKHGILLPNRTEIDGIHKHLFFINDRILMTDLSGEHHHEIDPNSGEIGPEVEKHVHFLQVNTENGTENVETSEGTTHPHELQVETTTLSGLHTHLVEINDEQWISLLPIDFINELERTKREYPSFKDFKLKLDPKHPFECNFNTIKRLNKSDMSQIIKKSAIRSIFKTLARLSEGYKLQSLVLDRTNFSDIGLATRFVLDHGLDIKSSEVIESQGVFSFQLQSKDSFVETSFQNIKLTEGVMGVIGLLRPEDVSQQMESGAMAEGTIDEFKNKQVKPEDGLSRDELRERLEERSRRFGIEVLEDAALTFPANFPTELDLYGDPVNLKFPFDTIERARNARVRFKQFATETYSEVRSREVVHNRIVERELELGVMPSFDPDDELDQLLSQDLIDRLTESEEQESSALIELKEKFKRVKELYSCDDIQEKEKKEKNNEISYKIVKTDDEKRLVYGPILVPEVVDLQDDIVSVDEIERCAHNYMIKLAFQNDKEFLKSLGISATSKRGFMHSDFSKKLAFVESFIAPVDFVFSNDTKISKGTWIGVLKVFDDEAWALIKMGKVTGFSIGGMSKSRKEILEY